LIGSPNARHGEVDHTIYDTGSIARFIASVGDWKTAPLTERECAMVAAGGPPLGNLTGPLQFGTG
jgi:hypothetical protein